MSDADDIREYLGISDDSAEWHAIEAVGPEHVALVAELVRLLREVRAILTGTPHRSHPELMAACRQGAHLRALQHAARSVH